jgi:hypothetical protein
VKRRNADIIVARQRRDITPRKEIAKKRRNAIEPIIGHCKDGSRNWLQGIRGDQINAIAVAIGFNMRNIPRGIVSLLFHRLMVSLEIQTAQPCRP